VHGRVETAAGDLAQGEGQSDEPQQVDGDHEAAGGVEARELRSGPEAAGELLDAHDLGERLVQHTLRIPSIAVGHKQQLHSRAHGPGGAAQHHDDSEFVTGAAGM